MFSEAEKHCCLLFDEMAIKLHLQYNSKTDQIFGFETVSNESEKYVQIMLTFSCYVVSRPIGSNQ